MRFVLFSIADGFIYFNGNNRLYKTRSDLTQKVEKIINENDTIYDAVITNDRSSLIYSTGNVLKVMNTRTDVIRQEFNAGTSPLEKLCLLRDSLLVSWSKDGTISFWTYKFGQLMPTPSFWFPGPACGIYPTSCLPRSGKFFWSTLDTLRRADPARSQRRRFPASAAETTHEFGGSENNREDD